MAYNTVIWDFNGTIVNDVELGIRSVNTMLAKRGLPQIADIHAYHEVFGFPVHDYYKRLGFDFDAEPYEILAVEWVEHYIAGESSLTLNEGFEEIHNSLHKCGVSQIILSSSETGMLRRQMNYLRIGSYFDQVLGLDNIYAGGKIEIARTCIGQLNQDTVLIGDTTHDADTALTLGTSCILYAGGHASRKELEQYGFPVIDTLRALNTFLF